MLPRRDSELEKFKTEIDLRDYAISAGFEYIRRQSCRKSTVLKHACGDKLVVARMPWNHYVYFNVHAGSSDDSGSIIDFVQARENASLGEVRKILRKWTGGTSYNSQSALLPDLQPSTQDAARVFAAWTKAIVSLPTNEYLTAERRLPSALLAHPIFHRRIRVDHRGNILFAHFNRGGLCGYEVKNRGFTGFSTGGLKGLCFSHPRDDDQEMIICETAIDMLSVAAIDGTSGRRFFSLAGQPSPAQIDLLVGATKKMPVKPRVLMALDNDKAGADMARVLRSALQEHCSEVVVYLPPAEGQDWNDVLKARSTASPQFRIAAGP